MFVGCWVDEERNEVMMWLNVWGNVCSSNWTTRSASRHFGIWLTQNWSLYIYPLFIVSLSTFQYCPLVPSHFILIACMLSFVHSQHRSLFTALCCTCSDCKPALCWAAASIGLYIVWWSIFIKLWHVTTPGICMGRILMKRKGFHLFAILNREDLLYTTCRYVWCYEYSRLIYFLFIYLFHTVIHIPFHRKIF